MLPGTFYGSNADIGKEGWGNMHACLYLSLPDEDRVSTEVQPDFISSNHLITKIVSHNCYSYKRWKIAIITRVFDFKVLSLSLNFGWQGKDLFSFYDFKRPLLTKTCKLISKASNAILITVTWSHEWLWLNPLLILRERNTIAAVAFKGSWIRYRFSRLKWLVHYIKNKNTALQFMKDRW